MATKHGSTATPVAATEDVIQALMEHLVQPLLPTKAKGKPDLSRQQSVAKQIKFYVRQGNSRARPIDRNERGMPLCSTYVHSCCVFTVIETLLRTPEMFEIGKVFGDLGFDVKMHAVVLLYNYYHRKQFPKLEYLDGESFCKVAVNAKRNLLAFMKDMSTLNIRVMLENQFSITEQQIVDACNICISLDASRVAPRIDEWPVSKIAVLLTDSTEKNCLLLHGSITAGVWSLIEKNLGESNDKSENTNKKRKTANSPLKDAPKANVSSSRALAFSAVKETTDIDQGDLIVLGSHVVYSLSEVKKSTHVYVMKCTRQIKEDVTLVPITEVIDSLQGPLIVKVSGDNEVSSVVEYFHLLPYAEILSDLHSRELLQNISEDVDVDYSSNNKKSPTPEVNRNIDILKKGNATSGRVNVKEKGQSHISGSPNAAFKSQSLAARNPSTSEKKNKVTESIFPTNHVGGKRKCYEPVITNTACKIKKDFLLKIPTLESENQEIQDLQAINDVQRKFDLEKQEIVKSEKEKADKRIQEMETKCDQKLVESKEESRQYLMRVQEEHDSLICSLQKKHDRMESSLMADYNKELEKIRLQGQEELDSKTTLLRKEHDVQMRALRRQYDDKCQKLQEELEFQKPKRYGKRSLETYIIKGDLGIRNEEKINLSLLMKLTGICFKEVTTDLSSGLKVHLV
ncbi:hypothetical protein GIB67_008408 [Kingdonia uniflora]|uniref:Uncharacterized protein n=1 Tax=Kingdonia uniflora TaxID=39325 RepID=A0A7J7N509_9MAGN|nr:hypothetical protein GIB67_008408 [Kingdonia uniflora]